MLPLIPGPVWQLVGWCRRLLRGPADLEVLRQVEPHAYRRLPPRHDVAHAVAFFFHDELARLLHELERVDSLSINVNVTEEEARRMGPLRGDDLWRWLEQSGRHDVMDDLTYRQLAAALIADASHFVSASLLASGKGKMTVAYALLRKPFKESLLILEWLCGDPDEFLGRFNGESIDGYVLDELSKDHRLRIMNLAVAKVDLPGLGDELMWAVRYAKGYSNGLETMWTQATHLVTKFKASKTEAGNLNFVFSSESAVEEQWQRYYSVVPLLLYYFLAIADAVVSRFIDWDEEARSTKRLLRNLAFFRWAEATSASEELRQGAKETFEELSEISFSCLSCRAEVAVSSAELDRFWLHSEMRCPRCSRAYDLWQVLARGRATAGVNE